MTCPKMQLSQGVLRSLAWPLRRWENEITETGPDRQTPWTRPFDRRQPAEQLRDGRSGERQKAGGQAIFRSATDVLGCGLNFGYQWRNTPSNSSLRTFVRVCSNRCVPPKPQRHPDPGSRRRPILKLLDRRNARQAVPDGYQPLRRPTGGEFC